jgi:hypothetical protein
MRLPDDEVHAALDALASGGPDREVGLSLTVPEVVGGVLTNVTEPAAADYARVTLLAADWLPASGRAVQTDGPVIFADPVDDWGVVVAYFVTDGAGVPSIAFLAGEAVDVVAGSTEVNVTPRISVPL